MHTLGGANRGYVARAFEDDIRDLGLLDGFPGAIPRGINNLGEIVGAASQGTDVRALYWAPGASSPIDLNTMVDLPGVLLVSAMDINNAGQILARGTGGYYIFTPVPEPGSLGLAALMVAALSRRTRAIAVDERRAWATR